MNVDFLSFIYSYPLRRCVSAHSLRVHTHENRSYTPTFREKLVETCGCICSFRVSAHLWFRPISPHSSLVLAGCSCTAWRSSCSAHAATGDDLSVSLPCLHAGGRPALCRNRSAGSRRGCRSRWCQGHRSWEGRHRVRSGQCTHAQIH